MKAGQVAGANPNRVQTRTVRELALGYQPVHVARTRRAWRPRRAPKGGGRARSPRPEHRPTLQKGASKNLANRGTAGDALGSAADPL